MPLFSNKASADRRARAELDQQMVSARWAFDVFNACYRSLAAPATKSEGPLGP